MAQRVPMRAGSLVLWDARVVHGSAPSKCTPGCRPRVAQFLCMRTSRLFDSMPEVKANRVALVRRLYQTHGLELPTHSVSRALLGLAPLKGRSSGEKANT